MKLLDLQLRTFTHVTLVHADLLLRLVTRATALFVYWWVGWLRMWRDRQAQSLRMSLDELGECSLPQTLLLR